MCSLLNNMGMCVELVVLTALLPTDISYYAFTNA